MEIPDRTPHVATSFLMHNGKTLLFRRSGKVGTYKGKWAAVSGYIERYEQPYETAIKEILQETGIMARDIKLMNQGEIEVSDPELRIEWKIHTFLFETKTDKIKPNWESAEFRWVEPKKIEKMDTVPQLKEALFGLLGKSGFGGS